MCLVNTLLLFSTPESIFDDPNDAADLCNSLSAVGAPA